MRLTGGFEPAHLTLLLTGVLMGNFSPVVLVLTGSMLHRRKDLAMSCRIASELVGDEFPWRFALVFQGFAEEALSGSTISPVGDQDIDYVPILIHGPLQVATLALDGFE